MTTKATTAASVAIKPLEGWLSLSEVGDRLGIASRQGVHHLLWDQCAFNFDDDVRAVPTRTVPTFVVRETAVEDLRRARALPKPAGRRPRRPTVEPRT